MCVFCRAFTALYGADPDIALNPDRWPEYDAIRLGGATSDRAAKRAKDRYRRKARAQRRRERGQG
ncbi:hypothetical protein [Actinomadura rupiterrae]|uniref:hypothetical protein n=1 Tax=Actinomadura rupiterrae TaxID=559627 RepID=UPI0020A4BCBB|nr:hypothetical protein [Actinomadura rupiterrae]MCP2339225.1 hypothetical protein [Actinomadura rupiterrae]